MIVGLDMDNTIVNCSPIFAQLAASRLGQNFNGLSRLEVRSKVRQIAGNQLWTQIQAEVYGPSYKRCLPYKGAVNTIKRLKENKLIEEIYIISHKTQFDAAGGLHNLQKSAVSWLKENLLQQTNIPFENVIFCETFADKIREIRAHECDVFLDDLETVLRSIKPFVRYRVLFAESSVSNKVANAHVSNWESFYAYVKNSCK